MIILHLLAGFFCAALSGMGVGGGGLLLLYLLSVAGFEQLPSQGTNIIFFIVAAAFSLIIHIKRRNINKRLIFFIIFFGLFGALSATLVINFINVQFLRKAFGGLLIFSGFSGIFKRRN